MGVIVREQGIPATRDPAPLPTSWILLGLLVAELVLAWSLNQVTLTREIFAVMAGDRLDPDQIDRMLALSQRYQWVSYAVALPSLVVRAATVALCLQLALLFFEELPVRFGVLFRVTLIAHVARLLETAFFVSWLAQFDGAARSAQLAAGNPLSLAPLVDSASAPVLHQLLGYVSLGQAAWVAIAVLLLASATGRARGSLFVTGALTWAILTALKFSFAQVTSVMRG